MYVTYAHTHHVRSYVIVVRGSASERARDWQPHFEEFSGLTRPSLRRHPSSPLRAHRLPPRSFFLSFSFSFSFSLSLSFSFLFFSLSLLSLTTLFWAYGLQLRAGRLGTPFCFIVRSSVRFCAHLPHSLSPFPSYPATPLLPLYRRSAASTYLRTALSRPTLCPSARFFLFFNIFFSSMP